LDRFKRRQGGEPPDTTEIIRVELTDDHKLSLEFEDGKGTHWTGMMELTSDGYHSGTFRGEERKTKREGTARATGYIHHRLEDGKWHLIGDWYEMWPEPDDQPWDGLFFAELEAEPS
jgi:hypothetical protein